MKEKLNKFFHWTGRNIHVVFLLAAAVFFCLSILEKGETADIGKAARSVERRLGRLDGKMEKYASRVLELPASQWADAGKVPDDIVIYKYVNDTLHSWINHFPLRNDEIIDGEHFGVRYNRLSRVQTLFMPLLSGVTETPSYMNIGSQWFVMRSYQKGRVKLICGILIKEDAEPMIASFGGINNKLKVPENMTVCPVAYSDGCTIKDGDVPVFNLVFKKGVQYEGGI